MRSVHYMHNLPTLVDKNITHRPILSFNFAPNSSVLFFTSIQQLILNTESIPLSLCLQSIQLLGLQIMITHNNLTLKHQLQVINLPLNVVKQKWLRINFGEEISKIEIRPQQNENKLDRTHFYSKIQIWKKEERKEITGLSTVNLHGSLLSVRNKFKIKQKMDRMIDNSNKKDISRYLKMKLIERSSITATNKPKLQPLRTKESSLHNCYGDQNYKSKRSTLAYQKCESTTLDFNPLMQNKQISARRDSNTSNSIRSQPTVIKFSRNINRLRDAKIRLSRNKDNESISETSQFIPASNHRPRFYEQISLSHEQIELKRRKFDSQFIQKQKVDLGDKSTVIQKENNESQVKQQINKMEGSKIGSRIQDTFQRGIFHNSRGNVGQADQESGTLCQSVFE